MALLCDSDYHKMGHEDEPIGQSAICQFLTLSQPKLQTLEDQ